MHLHTRWTKHVLAFIAACFVCLLHSTFTKAQHQVWLNNNKLWALDFLQIGNIGGHWVNWESVANLCELLTVLQLQQAVGDGRWLRLSKSKCKRTMRMTRNAMHYARILTLGCENGWGKFLHEVSAEQTTSVLDLPLVKGLKRNKGINCCIDFCKLQAFDAWVGELTEHNPTFIHTTNQHRFSHRNFAKEETKRT